MRAILSTIAGLIVLGGLVVLAAPAFATETRSLTIQRLFELLASEPQRKARFVETRYLSILEQPLVSTGTLTVDPSGQLIKRTLRPVREDFVLAGDILSVERPESNTRYRLEVTDSHALRAFVEAFRSTLAGDLRTLERFYHVVLQVRSHGWQLRLIPSIQEMRERVEIIIIEGAGARIERIETQEAGGDRIVMDVTPDSS